jgi:SAM-dependent methyltransferase
MPGAAYYVTRLSGDRLRRCYERAPRRVKQYLDAEIMYVVGRVEQAASVLELGCGYGRVLVPLTRAAQWVVGVDTSLESLVLARESTVGAARCGLAVMDAAALGFRNGAFDMVVCIQNGICAFRIDPRKLLREALRVTRPGGRLLFSSYSEAFWPHRLLWFERQAEEGLVGEIDYAKTTRGEIVCKDGFRSGALGADAFTQLCGQVGVRPTIVEVDQSSVFCEITVPGAA